ncbi:queuosine precursor transporter [Xenorhabdus bovienii]|uniref:queuosine precursor transporter n=1 Tax=Xenorhabdus bovienii TaxID=40576 RepID=UPI0023B2E7A7|nr:queuosine precursor transporter [Xenorhabdus bovienii]MDE9484030.1 queuosine precursor transporter [Xenorhabdus bovienii]MDE9555924.1 queuosine precursor transporter [Xenorhabdus bovienii]
MSGNQKYKLLGFSRSSDAIRANIMILSTGKSISIPLQELESSQVSEDLNRHELKEVYRRIYGGAGTVTAYDLTDRHERSWFAYLVIAFSLAVIYIFCTITGIKPVSIPSINMVIPSAIFFYPLTFILVDILNEFYGLRLARKAILFSFIANILFVLGLIFTAALPGLKEWGLEGAYTEIVHSIAAVLVASSIAYIVSENVNSWLLCKIKELTNSRYLFIRVITSTTVAAALDSIIFCTLAFYNTLDAGTIKSIIFSQFIIKLAYAIVGVGPIYGTRTLFKKYINA